MIKKKQIFFYPLKGHEPNNLKLEAEEKANNFNKNQPPQYRYKKTNTIMMMLIITTTMRIIEVNLEYVDLTEAKIQVDFSEVKIHMVEVNATFKIHIKANIRTIAIHVIITKVIMVYIITHTEIFNRTIIMANSEAEAVVMAEVITMDTFTVGPIIKATTTTNTISIMVMMMSTRQINMIHHVHYAVNRFTPQNIVLRENVISVILWKR